MFPFTLQQLRILKAIATEKNFTKAADILYLSQPSLSKQIKTLEKNLNVVLINRETNQISLTEQGKILLNYSERILPLCEEYCRVLIDLKNGERGNLTIGTTQIIGKYLLPRILELFLRNYPQVNLRININSTRIITQSIESKKVDIAIISGEIPNKIKNDVLVESFVDDEIHLMIPKYHVFASKTILEKEDLYRLNFITLNSKSSFRQFVDNQLIQNEIEINRLKIILELNSMEGIKMAVSLGLGVGFLSSLVIEEEIKLKTMKSIKIKNIQITQPLFFVNHTKSFHKKTCQAFLIELSKLKNNLENS